jgi:hypothetical protein
MITLALSPEIMALSAIALSNCSSDSSLTGVCSTLMSRGINKARTFKYAAGWSRRTLAMAFSPCLRKSRKSAQMTSSLNALREPRGRPAGFPRDAQYGATLRDAGGRWKSVDVRNSN